MPIPQKQATLWIQGTPEEIQPKPIPPQWHQAAEAKGFHVVARVRDRYHLALECKACKGLTRAKVYVVMNNTPICACCLATRQAAEARAAGLEWLERDRSDRHYAWYRARCGHRQRRQISFIARVARKEVDLRCQACHRHGQSAEAGARGWDMVGPDSLGRITHRLYRHRSCGAEQSVALANMRTGRFDCATCGTTWSAARSAIYILRFTLVDGEVVIKCGYSRDPVSRLHHQLLSGLDTRGEILRIVPLATGSAAIRAEKAIHRKLRDALPGSVVPWERFRGQIRVTSEIYTTDALPMIEELLVDLEAHP